MDWLSRLFEIGPGAGRLDHGRSQSGGRDDGIRRPRAQGQARDAPEEAESAEGRGRRGGTGRPVLPCSGTGRCTGAATLIGCAAARGGRLVDAIGLFQRPNCMTIT